jgi:hypothetical protein
LTSIDSVKQERGTERERADSRLKTQDSVKLKLNLYLLLPAVLDLL